MDRNRQASACACTSPLQTSEPACQWAIRTFSTTYRMTSTDSHRVVTLQARGKLSVRNLSPQLTICSSRGSLVVLTCPNKLCRHGECGKLLHTGARERDRRRRFCYVPEDHSRFWHARRLAHQHLGNPHLLITIGRHFFQQVRCNVCNRHPYRIMITGHVLVSPGLNPLTPPKTSKDGMLGHMNHNSHHIVRPFRTDPCPDGIQASGNSTQRTTTTTATASNYKGTTS